MGHSLERVYKDTSLKGLEKAVLAYLVYRANDEGLCYPGMTTIENECGISRNTRKRVMAALIKSGRISIPEKGHGRGNLNTIKICDRYTKGVKVNPLSVDKRGQNEPPLENEKGSKLTPFIEEKGSILTEKGSKLNVEEQEEHNNNNNYADPMTQMISEFESLTLLSPPHPSAIAYQDKWVKPLSKYLALCDGDVPAAVQLITDAIGKLRNNGRGKRYTIKTPASLDTTISNLVSAKQTMTLDAPDHGAIFDQYFSLMASRSRSMRGTVPGDYIAVVNSLGRGRFQNCPEKDKKWLRNEFVKQAQAQLQGVPA